MHTNNSGQKPNTPISGYKELNRAIQKGYDLMEAGDEANACNLWLKAWDILKTIVPQNIKTIEDAESLINGDQYLFNWVQDLEMGLANAAIDNPEFHEKRINYCQELIRMFPGSFELVKHIKLAIPDSLFQLGKKSEAEQEYKKIVVEYPKFPWGYIHWGDFYAGEDDVKAEEIYRKALGMDKAQDAVILDRIKDLKVG
jgi:tetratricopeptide (TPR) repeat protein